MSYFNPFSKLKETNRYPHARSYRTTFGQKTWDTFTIFFGDFTLPTRKRLDYLQSKGKSSTEDWNLGLFDYCTGFILHIITSFAFEGLVESKNPITKILCGMLCCSLFIPRLVFSAALTLICLPFIGVAQAYFSQKGDKLKQMISSHLIQDGSTTQVLGKLLEKNETPIDDIEIDRTKKVFLENRKTLSLTFFSAYSKKELKVVLNLNDKNHNRVFKSMSKLNFADLQGEIERNIVPIETASPRLG